MDVVINIVISLLTGFGLWAFLPRGVVLTRSVRSQDWRGEPLYDTWQLQNDSSLPILLTSVKVSGMATFDEGPGKVRAIDLRVEATQREHGAELSFDDEGLETGRQDLQRAWKGLVVPPGDTLQTRVFGNTLTIKYRRAGALGVLERREVSIVGRI